MAAKRMLTPSFFLYQDLELMAHPQDIITALSTLLEPGKVRFDTETLATYGRDWSKQYEPDALSIVFPKSTAQVQALVKLANEMDFALVPSGGRTGLSGGATAIHHEVVVSFDYMNAIVAFNQSDRTVRCQAGVITKQLQNFASENDLFYPVDFASSGSSQIGGNIATNAGGIKVIKYGMTRDWVLGLQVVTGTGEILELNHDLLKNNTGYDLRHLFIGSEGTLGFITEATMRLTRPPQNLNVLVLGLTDIANTMDVLQRFQAEFVLTAYEFFSHQAMGHVRAHHDIPAPFETPAPYYALLEFEAVNEATVDAAMVAFESCVEAGWVLDGVISQSETQAANLWRLREGISESITPRTPYKNDISVVVSKVPQFLNEINQVVTEHYPDFEMIWFGHIGDGNLHLNILKPLDLDKNEFILKCEKVNQWVFEIVQKYRGSVSAEHGVGLVKKNYLTYTRSPHEIAMMKGIKQVFDPKGVMNPGKIFD